MLLIGDYFHFILWRFEFWSIFCVCSAQCQLLCMLAGSEFYIPVLWEATVGKDHHPFVLQKQRYFI